MRAAFAAQRIEFDVARNRRCLCGYCFMDANARQDSLRMTV